MVKTTLHLWVDAEIKARVQARVENLSTFVENIFKVFLENPDNKTTDNSLKIKEELAAARAQTADLVIQLNKMKRKEAERNKNVRIITGESRW